MNQRAIEIRLELLSGRVDNATSLLNKYFPSVLSLKDVDISSISSSHDMDYVASTSVHPAHLNLNLRIQSFIESCRTVPLEYPPLPAQSTPKPKPEEFSGDSSIIDHQTNLLNNAKKLYAYLRMLPSKQDIERHEMELQNVIGLLAYKIPEESTVSRYMEQSRRAAVAEQINSAILCMCNDDLPSTILTANYLRPLKTHTHLPVRVLHSVQFSCLVSTQRTTH